MCLQVSFGSRGLYNFIVLLVILNYFISCSDLDVSHNNTDVIAEEVVTVQPAMQSEIRISSFNINFANTLYSDLVKNIRLVDADIVCLQETTPGHRKRFSNSLKRLYPYQEFIPVEGRYFASGMGILSKYPIVDFVQLDKKIGIFSFINARISLDDHFIQVMNVHLFPCDFSHISGVISFAQELQSTTAVQDRESRYITSHIDEEVPSVVLGDFNNFSFSQTLQLFLDANLSDSFAFIHKMPDDFPTWSWEISGIMLKYRLDYILVDAACETQAVQVHDDSNSDHKHISADVLIHW
ncbi:MAG: endonuclease/exonuclease/phosphatase family protein [Planctomycetes bacterium]|nr:endonuclease/exonuclease/phosphatase family protein [Planctomycetota bacterium]